MVLGWCSLPESLAAEGVKAPQNCKFTVTVDSIVILKVIEIIPATEEAQESIEGVKVWKAEYKNRGFPASWLWLWLWH